MMFNVGRSEYSSTLDKRSIPPRFNVVRLFMIPFLSTFRSYLVGYFFSLKNAQKFYQSLKKETKELKKQIEELKLNEQENHNESESTKRPSFNPLVGGGIAVAAAQAATKRNTNRAASHHPVKPSHSSNDLRDDDFTGGKNNSFSAIPAAAANAALLRTRAFTQTNSMFDDDSFNSYRWQNHR